MFNNYAHNKYNGFTLIELLVVMMIFSLVLTLAMTSYRFYTNQWEQRSDEKNVSATHVRNVWLVQQAVESAYDYYMLTAIDAYQERYLPYFYGQSHTMRWVTLSSVFEPGKPALAEILRLSASGDEPPYRLVYHEWSLSDNYLASADHVQGEPEGSLTLADGLKSVQIQYFGYKDRELYHSVYFNKSPDAISQQQWYEDYRSSHRRIMPSAVSISLTTDDDIEREMHFIIRAQNMSKSVFLNNAF